MELKDIFAQLTAMTTATDGDVIFIYDAETATLKKVSKSNLLAGVTGGGGDVTLTGTQTLTNKTISGAANTLTNISQSSVTSLTSDLSAKAPIASPTFTGTPSAPTATGGTNTTQLATTAFVTNAISGIGGGGGGDVTLAGAQTLTNKTMSGASNTFTNIPQSAITDLANNLAAKQDASASIDATTLAATSNAAAKALFLYNGAFYALTKSELVAWLNISAGGGSSVLQSTAVNMANASTVILPAGTKGIIDEILLEATADHNTAWAGQTFTLSDGTDSETFDFDSFALGASGKLDRLILTGALASKVITANLTMTHSGTLTGTLNVHVKGFRSSL